MRYSVKKHSYNGNNWDTFDKVMEYFAEKYVNGSIDDAKCFLYDFGEYLEEETRFPCDRIILNIFNGYNDRFDLILQYNGEKIVWLQIKLEKYGLINLCNFRYENEGFKKTFHNCIEQYIDSINNNIFNDWLRKCKVKSEGDNSIKLVKYDDYKVTDTIQTIVGTIEHIFDVYTSLNDRLRYCNGTYWRFVDNNIDSLYHIFVKKFKGNYFLMNAVNRGALID